MLAGAMAIAEPGIQPSTRGARTPEMPPRPDLSRLMMSAGFVLMPARFLDA
jgi:hypothetical protein